MTKKRVETILKHVVCILLSVRCASILYGTDQLLQDKSRGCKNEPVPSYRVGIQ